MNKFKTSTVGALALATVVGIGTGLTNSAASAATSSSSPNEIVVKAAAACVGPNAITTGKMFVDGKEVTFGQPSGFVQGGSVVSVEVTIKNGCDNVKFGLAAYDNPVPTYSPSWTEVEKQKFISSSSATLSGGQTGTLSLVLPKISNCQYQVDFFTGSPITKFTPGNYYGFPEGRLISVVHIAVPDCVAVLPEEASTSTSTTSTTQAVQAEEAARATTTTAANNVQPNSVVTVAQAVTSTTQASDPGAGDDPGVGADLASTGADTMGLAGAAGVLALIGGSMRMMASSLNRRRNAKARHRK